MKYVRYAFAALGILLVFVYAGNWVFTKEHLESPFASVTMARGMIIWGAIAGGLLAPTWKFRIWFACLGGLGAWAVMFGAHTYHLQIFPVP